MCCVLVTLYNPFAKVVWFNVPTSEDKAIVNIMYHEVVMQVLLSSDWIDGPLEL